MATKKTTSQARKSSSQATKTTRSAKSTAKKAAGARQQAARSTQRAARVTSEAASATGREAAATAEEARRSLSTLVRDGAYAAVGVGDTTVEMLRHAGERAEQVRRGAPKAMQEVGPRARHLVEVAPVEVRSTISGLLSGAGEAFDGYAARGRSVLGSISRGRATERASRQVRTARSQVKAASTSVRKAVEESVDAAASAADKVGAEGR